MVLTRCEIMNENRLQCNQEAAVVLDGKTHVCKLHFGFELAKVKELGQLPDSYEVINPNDKVAIDRLVAQKKQALERINAPITKASGSGSSELLATPTKPDGINQTQETAASVKPNPLFVKPTI